MKKLIGMVDFVLEQKELKIMRLAKLHRIENYANFLKQQLAIWQFVPCELVDGVWVVLEEANSARIGYVLGGWDFKYDMEKYQQAKERCLFDGIRVDLYSHNIIEDLVKYKPLLTATAQKQIGL